MDRGAPGDHTYISAVDYVDTDSDTLAEEVGVTLKALLNGDANLDARTDAADYIAISNNFGASYPEPATLALVSLGALGLFWMRCRRS